MNYLLTFVEGILTFVSPCLLPMLPIYFSYLAGASEDEGSSPVRHKSRLITNSIGFVIGFTLIFVALGATATSIGHFLKDHQEIFRKASGILMIVFGLNFMGIIKLGFLNFEKHFEYQFKELKLLNSIIFGIIFSFGWSSCTGALLGNALMMAANSTTVLEGILLLLLYSVGLGIPFLLSAVLIDKLKNILQTIRKYHRIIHVISGIVLIFAGILVFTDLMKYL